MRTTVLIWIIATSAAVLASCTQSPPRRCAAYDRAEAHFNKLTQEHLDPDFGHPSFAKAAEQFEAIADDCERKDRARFLAEEIRQGLAARSAEQARAERDKAEKEAEAQKARSARRPYRPRTSRRKPRPGTYCQYTVGGQKGLPTGVCYNDYSTRSARRRCERTLKQKGLTGTCECSRDASTWNRYCRP